jgi:hypothetical protein
VKVATHDRGASGDYAFYNPTSHKFFDQDGGRIIYFEGTYTNTFSGNSEQTPLYDYNQIMYRLDLGRIPNLFPRIPGDYNRDGFVDSSDYVVWRKAASGETNLAADGNGDGVINTADYAIWSAHFGASTASTTTQVVPEPSGWLLLALLTICYVRPSRCI